MQNVSNFDKNPQGIAMHLSIQRIKLVESVNDVMKAVSSRTTIPILTGLKLTAHENTVILTGSDSDISIESTIPLQTEEEVIGTVQLPGSIVLQARFFAEIVKKLPGDTVDITVDERFTTTIRSGASEFNLNGLDPEEYPHLPKIEEDYVYSVKADLLKHVIKQTVFAVSTSETRPVLTGVNWVLNDGKLSCVATDSHRLASRTISVEGNEEEQVLSNVVIPGKSLNELAKILDDTDEWIDFVFTESQILFKAKQLLFFSRLLDGNYPDTNRLIPSESKTDLVVSTKEMLQAIERASLLAREGRNNVIKFVTINDDEIEISSNSPEIGRVFEKISTKQLEGEDIKISFSAKFMLDALRAIDSAEIRIRFTGAMRPFLLQPLEDESVLQLILPVRTY
jgi:DNA polymerase-3 subunit beta